MKSAVFTILMAGLFPAIACGQATVAVDPLPIRFDLIPDPPLFDRALPVNKQAFKLQIPAFEPDVIDVVVESFGFRGGIPQTLQSPVHSAAFATALKRARVDPQSLNILHTEVPANGDYEQDGADRIFTLTHPRLYFGRDYLFVITQYKPAPVEEIQKATKEALINLFSGGFSFERLATRGLTADELLAVVVDAVAKARLKGLRVAGPTSGSLALAQVLDRDALSSLVGDKRVLIGDTKASSVLDLIATQATLSGARDEVSRAMIAIRAAGKPLATGDLEAAMVTELDTAVANKNWSDVVERARKLNDAVGSATARPSVDGATKATLDDLSDQAIAPLHRSASQLANVQTSPDKLLEDLATRMVFAIPTPKRITIVAATKVQPLPVSTNDELPFLVSLDAGLLYIWEFEEVMPMAGLNLKFNRTDFDDPLNYVPEFSATVALTLQRPADLDPDYKGMIGDASLLLGIGARLPRLTKHLRFQTGALLFKQKSENPLSDDVETNVSLFFGVSLNWDAIDQIRGMVSRSNRPDFSALGGELLSPTTGN